MRPYLIFFAVLIFMVLLVISFRPISLSKEDSVHLTGIVESTSYDETNHDLSIKLVGDSRTFYINRAFEKKLYPLELVRKLDKNSVKLSFADQWTLFDPFGKIRHITELAVGDSLIFSEIE